MLNIIALLLSVSLLATPGAEGLGFPAPQDWRTQLLPPADAESIEALEEALAPWRDFVEKYSAWPYERRDWPAHIEQWRELVEEHFEPRHVELALAVIKCESSGDPKAVNSRSQATGLWQHLPRYWDRRSDKAGVKGRSPRNPEAATVVAAWLVYNTSSSWNHWTCARSMDWE